MKHLITCLFLLVLFSCQESNDNKKDTTPTLPNNIAIITNQGIINDEGSLTVIDLNTNTVKEVIDLRIKLKAFKDAGNDVNDVFIQSPRPHYVQASYDGKFVYVVSTFMKGAVIKLDAEFNVLAFQEIKNTTFPAHLQLTKDNKEIFLSTWTTNAMMNPSGVSGENNYMIHLNADDLSELHRYETPAGAHGIKLTPDEKTVIIGHDMVDYINIIDVAKLDQKQNSEFALRPDAATDGSDKGKEGVQVLSPTQLGITPDGKFAFFSCKEASKVLVYNIQTKDTVGLVDLKETFGLEENLGPYSIEVGPKTGYESATNKYAYINFKVGGYFARFKINPDGTTANEILTADKTNDILTLRNKDARPHGLDITDDGKTAVVSAEFLKSNRHQGYTFIVDLEQWKIVKELETKVESRGLCIYPSKGN